jgi:hypothetical protein
MHLSTRGLALFTALAIGAAGCLANTHKISKGELQRLSQTPPERRGDAVRTLQELGNGSNPPPAGHVESNTHVSVGVIVFDSGGRPASDHHHSGGGGGGSGGGGSGGHGSGIANAKSEDAKALFVLAAIVAIGAAFTEGARYDGWTRVHPMHPVHLWGPGGYTVIPLAHIDPETAAWADEAVIRETEGPWAPLGRAPFDRTGFAFNVFGGTANVPGSDDTDATGFAFHIGFGYFWSHQMGLLLDYGAAMRDMTPTQSIFDSQWSLELDFAPVDAGPFHAGVFGAIGLGTRYEDGYDGGKRDYLMVHGGALVQLSLTTRLALTGRFGIKADEAVKEATFGLSIY